MERWEERDRNVIFITARSKAGSRFLARENYRKIVNSILSGSIQRYPRLPCESFQPGGKNSPVQR
jgi:hypothetical protein